MGIEDLYGFNKYDFQERMEALAQNGNFPEIRRQEIKSIRKRWGAGTGTAIGGLAAIPTLGLSLIGSGIGARRLYIHNKKVEIAQSVLGKYGFPPYEPSLSDKWVPAIASTVGFGVGMGMDGGIANHLIDSGAQHLGIAGVTPEAHHGVADSALSRASSAGASAAITSTLDYGEIDTPRNRPPTLPGILPPIRASTSQPRRRVTVPIPQAVGNTKALGDFRRRNTKPYSGGGSKKSTIESRGGVPWALKLFLSLLAGGFWYVVFKYHDRILLLEISWAKTLLSHLPAFLLSVLDWVRLFVVAVVWTAIFYASIILYMFTFVLYHSFLSLLGLVTMSMEGVFRGFRWLTGLGAQLLVALD